ncbi:MAG: UPF0175 family protein [Bacteroidota bacterium]
MTITISKEISNHIGLKQEELLLEIAILLFQQERLTLSQASKLVEWHQAQFQKELGRRKIPIHYGEDELLKDIETLQRINL